MTATRTEYEAADRLLVDACTLDALLVRRWIEETKPQRRMAPRIPRPKPRDDWFTYSLRRDLLPLIVVGCCVLLILALVTVTW